MELTENTRNSASRFSTIEGSLQFPVIIDQQLDGVEDRRSEALGHKYVPCYENVASKEQSNTCHETDPHIGDLCLDQNGKYDNYEDPTFQGHCGLDNSDWNCSAEPVESCFDAGFDGPDY